MLHVGNMRVPPNIASVIEDHKVTKYAVQLLLVPQENFFVSESAKFLTWFWGTWEQLNNGECLFDNYNGLTNSFMTNYYDVDSLVSLQNCQSRCERYETEETYAISHDSYYYDDEIDDSNKANYGCLGIQIHEFEGRLFCTIFIEKPTETDNENITPLDTALDTNSISGCYKYGKWERFRFYRRGLWRVVMKHDQQRSTFSCLIFLPFL